MQPAPSSLHGTTAADEELATRECWGWVGEIVFPRGEFLNWSYSINKFYILEGFSKIKSPFPWLCTWAGPHCKDWVTCRSGEKTLLADTSKIRTSVSLYQGAEFRINYVSLQQDHKIPMKTYCGQYLLLVITEHRAIVTLWSELINVYGLKFQSRWQFAIQHHKTNKRTLQNLHGITVNRVYSRMMTRELTTVLSWSLNTKSK